jgi:hypothetical protein
MGHSTTTRLDVTGRGVAGISFMDPESMAVLLAPDARGLAAMIDPPDRIVPAPLPLRPTIGASDSPFPSLLCA